MTIPIKATTLADASTATGLDIAVDNCQDFGLHRFYVSLEAGWAGAVQIRSSATGSGWVDMLSTDITAAGNHVVEIERPFQFLQLHWTGNGAGKTITVTVEQVYSDPTSPGF